MHFRTISNRVALFIWAVAFLICRTSADTNTDDIPYSTLTSEELDALLKAAQLPTLKKSISNPIKINSHGTFGYKRLNKNLKEEMPSSTIKYLKKNRVQPQSQPNSENVDEASSSNVFPLRYMSNDINSIHDDPPPHDQVAKVARFIVKDSDWLSISTISAREPTIGFPFTNVLSTSDGEIGDSSGNPYMYMTPLDMTAIDLQHDSRASIAMSLAQGNYCQKNSFDPEDPRCARVILTGNIVKVNSNSSEEAFAKAALFSRHPGMRNWPKDHGWFFAKLNISSIAVLDFFGGVKAVSTDDYYNAELDN